MECYQKKVSAASASETCLGLSLAFTPASTHPKWGKGVKSLEEDLLRRENNIIIAYPTY